MKNSASVNSATDDIFGMKVRETAPKNNNMTDFSVQISRTGKFFKTAAT